MTIEIMDFSLLAVGFVFGLFYKDQSRRDQERKTFEQVDEEVRNDLAVKTNLVKSLKDDVSFLRNKIEQMKIQLGNK